MATIKGAQVVPNLTVTLELTEQEARALSGIFGYSVDAFLKAFYEKMGKAYVQPHEAGVRSLHKSIRSLMNGPLHSVDVARKAMNEAFARHKEK